MPTFRYIAKNSEGKRIDGTLEAADRNNAMLMIQQLGHTPLSLNQTAEKSSSLSKKSSKKKKSVKFSTNKTNRMKPRAMLIFTRELADLISSGMTLGRALTTLARRDSDPTYSVIVKRLRDEVIQGTSISDALRIYPETFPNLYISMVRAGEAGGALSESLQSLCLHYDRVQKARSKVISALIYPAIVLIVGILSVILLMTWLVPMFSSIFDELGGAMPLSTQILMGISNFMTRYGILLLLILFGAIVAFRKFIQTPDGKKWLHKRLLTMPVVSGIVQANAFALFARTLQTLIHNGVPILKALTISEETVGNVVIAAEISSARARVTDGSSIAGPLAAGGVFPPLLTDMLSVGEETGDLPGALSQIARRYDEELDFSIKVLTTVLEPILILGVAIIIGFVVISILLAVFSLTGGMGA